MVLAEDDEAIRNSLVGMLEDEYEVVASVGDGQTLVEAAILLRPDLLLIDVSMPVMNGLEALKRIRDQGSQAKVAMISTSPDPGYVRRAFELGARAYVLKALAADDLKAALRKVLDGATFVSTGIQFPPVRGRAHDAFQPKPASDD